VKSFDSRAKPEVRTIVIDSDINSVKEKYNIEGLDALDPTFVSRLRAKKEKEYDNETRELDRALGQAVKEHSRRPDDKDGREPSIASRI
jgi:hypothetical protein